MADLRLHCYAPKLEAGCCPAQFYALVMSRNHTALKNDGGGNYALAAYLKDDHPDYAIPLNEHPERTKYYYVDLDEAQFTLPPSAKGEEYLVEIWRRQLAGDYNRDEDELCEVKLFRWSGEKLIASQLDDLQENAMATYQSHIAVSYDSENQLVHFLAFLDRNGVRITDPINCEVTWVGRDGTVLAHDLVVSQIPGVAGVFTWDHSSIDLNPDDVAILITKIQDADGNFHETNTASISWD